MGCCAVRCIFLTICIVQFVGTVLREILDFLGYMWTPIIINFIHILALIFGIFGAHQYKIKFLIVYSVWNVLWLAWNVFVICIYFEAGILSRESAVLHLGTGSRSWWLSNGAGCRPLYTDEPVPTAAEGCMLEYYYVEALQAAVHALLAVFGVLSAMGAIYVFNRDNDTCSRKFPRTLPYSIEFQNNVGAAQSLGADRSSPPRPMTPRKVKQRSTRSKRGSRRHYQNPVTKLINTQNNHSTRGLFLPGDFMQEGGQSNPSFQLCEPPTRPSSAAMITRPNSILYLHGQPLQAEGPL